MSWISGLVSAGASVVGSLFGGSSKPQETTTTSYVDYGRMVRDAEAAGFNPLTALRNGGAAGFSVTKGTTPATPLSARTADGFAGATQSFLANFDPFSDKKRELEYSVIEAQLHNLQADTALKISEKNKFGSLPSVTGSSRIFAERPALSKKSAPSGLGAPVVPEAGETTVTNPYHPSRGIHVNPYYIDADAFEQRYGDSEIASTAVAVGNAYGDARYNLDRQATKLLGGNPDKSQLQFDWTLPWLVENLGVKPMLSKIQKKSPPLSGKRSRLRSYQ